MLYFKHLTSDRIKPDARLVIKKYGMEGYGILTVLREIVAEYVKSDNQSEWGMVDPMYDIDLLADECHTTVEKLKDLLHYCDDKKIFDKKDGRLYWEQIKERLDEYSKKVLRTKSSEKDNVQTVSVQGTDNIRNNRVEQSRVEQNRIIGGDEKTEASPPIDNKRQEPTSIGSVLLKRKAISLKGSSPISTEWQDKATRYAKGLNIDLNKLDSSLRARYFKIFKDAAGGRNRKNLEIAYSYLADYTLPITLEAKVKYLFWIYENGPQVNMKAGFVNVGLMIVAAAATLLFLLLPPIVNKFTPVKAVSHIIVQQKQIPTQIPDVSKSGRGGDISSTSPVLFDIREKAREIAKEFKINPDTFECVIEHESGFHSRRPDGSLKCGDSGASCGLGQIQLATWKSIRRHAGWSEEDLRADDIENLRTTAYGLSTLWYEHWTAYQYCHYQLGMNL